MQKSLFCYKIYCNSKNNADNSIQRMGLKVLFDNLRKGLFFRKMQLLFNKGVADGKIISFDDEFYEKLRHTYISGLPVSIHIKYLKPILPPGRCFDRSLYMFFCFDEAILVRGDNKDLEFRYGKGHAEHGWIEMDNYVYDPSLMMRFDKDLYYEIYKPTNVSKCTKEEYCSSRECQELYNDIKNTTIADFKPLGRKRRELSITMPLIMGIAQNSGNQEFINELNDFIALIQYDEEEVYTELNAAIRNTMSLLHN